MCSSYHQLTISRHKWSKGTTYYWKYKIRKSTEYGGKLTYLMKTKIKDSFDQVWATASTSWIPCWSSSKGTPGSSAPLFGSASSGWVTGPSDFSASTVLLSTSTEELAASSLSTFIRWSTDRALCTKGRSVMIMDMKHKIPSTQIDWRFQEYFETTRERQVKYKIKHGKFPHKPPKSAHWLAVFWMLICGSKWQSFPPISKVLQHVRCKYNVVQTYLPSPWTLSPLEPKTTRRRSVTRSNQIASGLEIITVSSYRHGDPIGSIRFQRQFKLRVAAWKFIMEPWH